MAIEKPLKLPEWDSTGVNAIEPDLDHKEQGWLAPGGVPEKPPFQTFNWWQKEVYRWIEYMDDAIEANTIYTQANFDAVFDGTTLRDMKIILKKGVIFLLNNNVGFGSNLTIVSNGAEVRRNGQFHFISVGAPGAIINNVHMYGWHFDGQGGIINGGSTTLTANGGFADISYVEDSTFTVFVRNCKVANHGGAYIAASNSTANNIIKNIKYCTSTQDGGVCYNCDKSDISNIQDCTALFNGGACYNCNRCNISNIQDCTATNSGGGCSNCYDCNISNIKNCTANQTSYDAGGGACYDCDRCDISNIQDCTVPAQNGGACCNCDESNISNIIGCSALEAGGACYNCNRCNISNIRDCDVNDYHGQGGGCSNCDYCDISNIKNCTAPISPDGNGSGGGCCDCNNGSISNISDCTANQVGGAFDCDNVSYFGIWNNNDAGGSVSPNNINNSDNSIAFCLSSTPVESKVVTTPGTVSW